jgi:hypothetical protein
MMGGHAIDGKKESNRISNSRKYPTISIAHDKEGE